MMVIIILMINDDICLQLNLIFYVSGMMPLPRQSCRRKVKAEAAANFGCRLWVSFRYSLSPHFYSISLYTL